MSNNRKVASTAKKVAKPEKKAKREKTVDGLYPQMYIGASGVCCRIGIHKKNFIKRLLEADDKNGFVSLFMFPLKEISKTNCTHFVLMRTDDDYLSEQDIVSNRIKELGL